jgi:hypothetical protein
MTLAYKDARAVTDDGIGRAYFFIDDPQDLAEMFCHRCKVPVYVAVRYQRKMWQDLEAVGIPMNHASLIYKAMDRAYPLGVTCGCYAKFHRQIVHIKKGRTHARHG